MVVAPYCGTNRFAMSALVILPKSFAKCMPTGVRCFSKVGFVGLGNMGTPMARNLIKKGYQLTVFDVNKSAVTGLVEAGAKSASNPAEVARDAEAVISMLPSNQHVLSVYSEKDGILSTARKNTLLIDSSTIDPSVAQTVATAAEKREMTYADCPVSGGVIAANDATLTFIMGGSKTSYELAKPLLEAMGSRIVHCGGVGMGQAAKLCNNMLLAISMIGTAEAFNLGRKLGLDQKVLASIINSSSGQCWASQIYNPVPGIVQHVPSSNNYEGGFDTSLMAKDLSLAQAVAARTEASVPLGSLAHQIYRALVAQGLSKKDFTVVYQFLKGQN